VHQVFARAVERIRGSPPSPVVSCGHRQREPSRGGVEGRVVRGDPTETDPDKYKVVFENDRVRVLE
jgi:hypothetical protein